MAHGPEHHIEHAEHSAHAAHDPFDKRVTVTIAIVAALLAAVTLLSHRAHNQTLQLQLQANDSFTKATNAWNRYQSKKNRQYLYQTADKQTRILRGHPLWSKDKDSDAMKQWNQDADKDVQFWQKQSKQYKKDTDKIEKEARDHTAEAEKLKKESVHVHHLGDRYDLAELGVEIGLVLCSLAVLTKKRGFWFSGMACGAVGVVLMGIGVYAQYLVHH